MKGDGRMKLLCLKDIRLQDSITKEDKGQAFTKGQLYNSRFFAQGTQLYAIDDTGGMHQLTQSKKDLDDSWFLQHFKIVDVDNNDW